ncbi:amino acid ABC transporter permease [Pasteurellaceae bacterium HPA106]|uniref:amino acid ABC transporter permease n=1 Tax=Spirabiliibacterium pneumoniae TaxID=221400 RepID=UPI001AAD7FA3|nr:amino acid ABC transporter permease [Spirabiliibacterium pneumoniae]MBE2895682.1 amino acid ABC transporter permease [Spirabiliibacterium pneumoniae]
MSWDYIATAMPQFAHAALITLVLSLLAIILSLILGLFCALCLSYRYRVLSPLCKGYVELSRNTPLLIQLFFLYFGLTKLGISLSGFVCAVIGLTFLGGAYMAESFRAGIEAVSIKQIEAGKSLGLRPCQVFYHIVLPQACAIALPSLGANGLFLVKETSVVSAIAVGELMFVTKDVIGMDYKTNEALFLLVVFYLVILLPLSWSIGWLERKQRRAAYGH